MTSPPRFHLAFPVRDLSEARAFYGTLLGCREGRSTGEWVDFVFFGHQIVAHLSKAAEDRKAHNVVDGEDVPVRHFGVIVSMEEWRALARKLNVEMPIAEKMYSVLYQGLKPQDAIGDLMERKLKEE